MAYWLGTSPNTLIGDQATAVNIQTKALHTTPNIGKPMAEENPIHKLISDEKELTSQGVVLDYVKRDVALLNQKFDEFSSKIDSKYVLKEEFDGFKKGYEDAIKLLATKEELASCVKDVDSLTKSRTWVVSLIIGAVILAVLSLVIIKIPAS